MVSHAVGGIYQRHQLTHFSIYVCVCVRAYVCVCVCVCVCGLRGRFHCASRQDPCFAAGVVGGSPVMGDLPSIDAVPLAYLSVVLQRQ